MKHGKITAKAALWAGTLLFGASLAFGATLTATPDHNDFGTIDEGINAVITIVVENTGSSRVEITNVQTS